MTSDRRFVPGFVLSPAIALLATAALAAMSGAAGGHDTWLQVSTRVLRPEDVVHVDLFLGNHGNDHRDFKVAGKLASLDGVRVAILAPGGGSTDLVPSMVDLGYAPREGFHSARFVSGEEGLHCVSHTREGIRHGARGLKGGKAYFFVSESLDKLPAATKDHAKPLGHPLELVPETHPVLGCGPGKEIAVRLLLHGKPLADHRVSFIPRGEELAEGFDPKYERMTDADGLCRFTPKEGNLLLVVSHLVRPEERGEGYERTQYSATLVIDVPQRCPCCDDP